MTASVRDLFLLTVGTLILAGLFLGGAVGWDGAFA